jgi:hypothetical protein
VRAPVLLALLVAAGCGYHVGTLHGVRSLSVPVFENQTERRLSELELTNAVVRDLRAQGLTVNRPEAPYVLKGEIVDIDQPTVVEGRQDVVVVGSVAVKMRLELRERGSGKMLWTDQHTESAAFSGSRGQSLESARAEVYDRLARWVTTKLEQDWSLE